MRTAWKTALLSLALVLGLCRLAGAQETPPVADAQQSKRSEELLQRLEKVERELERLKGGDPAKADDVREKKVHLLLESEYLGNTSRRSGQGERFFAARLVYVNLTDEAITVPRDAIRLAVNGESRSMKEPPNDIRYFSFQLGDESRQLRDLQPAAEVKVPPGGAGATWVLFTELPEGNDIPRLELRVDLPGGPAVLDVNQFARGLLGLTAERIGPRGSLALLTISGTLDTVNVKDLVAELDRATADKVARAVIRWTESAGAVDPQILAWLQQSAMRTARGEGVDSPFPAIPASIRELHFAAIPGTAAPEGGRVEASRDYGWWHDTDVNAVSAALRTAYEVLPRDELLQEIEQGHPLSRAAALIGGGGRLPTEKLPLILGLADDPDPRLQEAALVALRHFGEPPAVEKLLEYVRKNVEPLSMTAVESLAGSRYSAAHEALLKVLKNEPPESKRRIVEILARYPRPIWSEPIYEFASDPASGVGVEALRALARIGHPKLLDVIRQALYGENKEVSAEAFKLLIARNDPQSEKLAVEFTLEQLKESPPTPQMLAILNRTKDPRAVPLLLQQLEKGGEHRASVIAALGVLGDQSVADVLVAKYPDLRDHEKNAVLNALLQLKSEAFRGLAGEALAATEPQLVGTACRGLQADGSPEAVAMLIKALGESNRSSTWSYVTNTLAALATPEAVEALREARDSGNVTKRNYALNALRNIWQRSPGYPYIYRGQELAEQQQWAQALEQYSTAIKLDPQLPDAYAGRANVLLKQEKIAEAKADFNKAIELDPYNSIAIAGLGIALVEDGKHEEAIRLIEEVAGRFKRDQLFAYNSACVYSRAYGRLKEGAEFDGRAEKMAAYKDKAIALLQQAVKLRFSDFAWMKQDPDLVPLHDLPEFQKILSQGD